MAKRHKSTAINAKKILFIYKVMGSRSITIRLLDPPLHEFLPNDENSLKDLVHKVGMSYDMIKIRVEDLKGINPMLGHRGCKLAITYPEITEA